MKKAFYIINGNDFLYTATYNGEKIDTLDEAYSVLKRETDVINAQGVKTSYDYWPGIEVRLYAEVNDGHHNYMKDIQYTIVDAGGWHIPTDYVCKSRVVSKEAAIAWMENYARAIASYEKRVNALPEIPADKLMHEAWFGGANKAYDLTPEERAAMPKEDDEDA